MKYLIIMPVLTQVFEQSYSFPIGMAYVSSSLKSTGREVYTYNLNYKPGTIEDNVARVIAENDIDVVATGGLTAQYWQLERIIAAAKAAKPEVITVVGGGIITSSPEPAMKAFSCADYGIIGEGEITICELAEALEGKREKNSVKGIIYKENCQWFETEKRPEITDLDALPYPDYEGFEYGELLDKMPTDIYALNQGRFGMVSFGRSCPFNCTFCFHPSGSKYRKRSIDSVFNEIDYLIEKYAIRNIAVTDELFVAKIEDVKEFCRRIKERNMGFVISLRVDMVNREMLTLLKESGCLSIGFGLESADNTILKSMKKHITVEQIDFAMGLCYELGLNCMGNFIFGDQNETMETAMNTINWWKNHPQYKIAMHYIVLYPGSELYKIAVQKGLIADETEHIKAGCPYVNVSKLTDQEYRDLFILISTLNQNRYDKVENASVKHLGFGKVCLSGDCPKCGAKNSWNNEDLFRSLGNIICGECGAALSTVACDYINDEAEINFRMLSDRKIGIWPVITSVSEFLDKVPSALKDNVYLIDKSEMKQGGVYRGKKVYAPSVIEDENIDTVFISVTTSIANEIIDSIKRDYKSVKNILFLGDLIRDDFKDILN